MNVGRRSVLLRAQLREVGRGTPSGLLQVLDDVEQQHVVELPKVDAGNGSGSSHTDEPLERLRRRRAGTGPRP